MGTRTAGNRGEKSCECDLQGAVSGPSRVSGFETCEKVFQQRADFPPNWTWSWQPISRILLPM